MELIVRSDGQTQHLPAQPGQTILQVLQTHGAAAVHAPCGGKGTCKKCAVFVRAPGQCGVCLACQTPVCDGMVVELAPEVRLTVAETGTAVPFPSDGVPSDGEDGYAAACDIGTTTVVCHLLRLRDGARLATVSGGNAQRIFGADVIARITACAEGFLQKQTEAIVEQLNRYLQALCARAGVTPSAVRRLAVAGNTVMCHLLEGLSPESIGAAPFTPLSLFGQTVSARGLGLCFDGEVYLAPAVAGYVGGDITADVLATRLHERSTPALLIDVGTNGEMILGCGQRFVCCATAAGPAFEGAQIKLGMTASDGAVSGVRHENGALRLSVLGGGRPVGICGSGLIDALAVMLELGAVDETGRLLDEEEAEDAARPFLGEDDDGTVFYLTSDRAIYVTQADVRKVQLAKAAIAAGISVLAETFGVRLEEISSLLLAGGFGAFIRPESAARIGLIPQTLLPVTRAVGNAAGEGAVSLALSQTARESCAAIRDHSEYVELSLHKGFQGAYVEAMLFEHAIV